MGNFNRDRSFDRGSDRETFKATCADCGKFCELPFKPSNGRPVYCRNCFKKHSPEESRGRDAGRGHDRFSRSNDRSEREMFEAVCANCGANCRVPFRPNERKDTLCSRCFEGKGGDSRRITNGSGKELSEINAKLDKILEILNFAQDELEKEESEEIAGEPSDAKAMEGEETTEEVVEKPKKPTGKKTKSKKKPTKKA